MTTNNNRTRLIRSQALPAPRTLSRRGLKALLAAALLAAGSLLTTPAVLAAPPVIYNEPAPDLAVKVLGGKLVVQRSFIEGKWYSNANWAPLKLTYDTLDGSVKSITRGRAEYTRLSPGVFRDESYYTIRQTSSGFTWSDRAGNTIDYDAKGYIKGYADRNGVKVSFTSETTSSGATRLTGAFDHHGNQALWFEYTGDDLTRIRDRTHREVRYQYNGAHELTQVTDANGHPWTYTYSGGVPVTFTDPENRTVTRAWAGNGELARIRYPDNTGVDYLHEYDSGKSLYYTQEKTTGGRVTETWSTLDGKLLRKDINGKTVETRVPETTGSRSRTQTDARGLTTTETLDEWGNVTRITYPDGSSTSATYEPTYSNPLTRTDELGVVTKYEYDAKGNLTRMTEALGLPEQRVTEYTYDQFGQQKTEKRVGDAVTQEALTQFDYDGYGNLIKLTDAEANVTEYPAADYDVQGNPKKKIDARGKAWTRTYDNRGHVLTDTDPLNHTNATGYDKAGWETSTTDAVGNVTQYSYDPRGNLIAITNPYGAVTRYEYNSDNQRTKAIDAENKTIQTIEYDLDGRVSKQIDGNNNVIQYVYGDEASGLNGLLVKTIYPTYSQEYKYDNRNRIVDVIDVLDSSTKLSAKTTYDTKGNEFSVTDANGKITRNAYDALGRLKTITDALDGVTEYVYDNRDNAIALKDAKGHTHSFQFNRINQKTNESLPLGQAIAYAYTPTGHIASIRDPKGQIKEYNYDAADRVAEERHYATAVDKASNIAVRTTTYTFNDLNRLSGYSDTHVASTIAYDGRQIRKTGERINYDTFSLSYNYDYFANGQKKSFTSPDGVTVNYTYDTNNQLATIQLPSGNLTVNSYMWSAPTQITLPGGTIRTQSFNPLLRLTQIRVRGPGQSELMNYQYDYDSVGNIKTKNTEHGNYSYSYDDLYRLTQAQNASPLVAEGYVYDEVDNRVTDTRIAGTWVYNENNQLQSGSGAAFEYDANGNTTKKIDANDPTQTRNYVYDTADRLIEVRDANNTLIATYAYDPFNRRIAKETMGAAAAKTWFFYSDEGLIAEADNNGAVTRGYGYRPDSVWGTNPVYLKQGSETFYYQNDHLGNPQMLVTQSGTVVWSAQSEAFGQTTVDSTSTITNHPRSPGQYYDSETGLHYNWHRYYDPKIGRYITRDPIGLMGGLNLYAYVVNNPVAFSDPRGLVRKLDPNGQECRALAKKIEDIRKDIAKRETEVAFNPGNLPLLPPRPGAAPRESVVGHQGIIDGLKGTLQRRLDEYAEKCGCDPDNGCGGNSTSASGVPSPAASPSSNGLSTSEKVGIGTALVCIGVCVLAPQACPFVIIGGASVRMAQ